MAKDSLWFKHDLNARNDLKTEAMIDDYGAQGYGTYWWIVEKLHEERNAIPLDDLFYRNLYKKMKWKELGKVKQFINDCAVHYNLFTIEENMLSAGRVEKNLKELKISADQLSEVRSKSGKKGAERRWQNNSKNDFAILPMANDGKNGIDKIRIDKIREEEREATKASTPEIGSDKVAEAANAAWKDQKWREAICIGLAVKDDSELKKWMAQFNASLCNDTIADFTNGKYKKIFRGWLANEKEKGRSIQHVAGTSVATPSRFKDLNQI